MRKGGMLRNAKSGEWNVGRVTNVDVGVGSGLLHVTDNVVSKGIF